MRLLELSIRKDGLTMPIVVATEKKDDNWVVVDGPPQYGARYAPGRIIRQTGSFPQT